MAVTKGTVLMLLLKFLVSDFWERAKGDCRGECSEILVDLKLGRFSVPSYGKLPATLGQLFYGGYSRQVRDSEESPCRVYPE